MGRTKKELRLARKKKAEAKAAAFSKRRRTALMAAGIADSQKDYATEWGRHAQMYDDEGDYRWLASVLQGCGRVLDIGTGDGRALAALLHECGAVVSVDENIVCTQMAASYLAGQGHDVEVLARGNMHVVGHGYEIQYKEIAGRVPVKGALLIEGDILNDRNLIEWLIESGPFDAITCWMIGTHSLRFAHADCVETMRETHRLIGLRGAIDAHLDVYRLRVQKRLYELADEIVHPGGLVHVVDRGFAPSDRTIEEGNLQSYQADASATSVIVERIDYRKIHAAGVDGAIEMKAPPGASALAPKPGDDFALVSVIARRPLKANSV